MNNYCKHVFRAARRLSHNVRLLYYNMQDNNMHSVGICVGTIFE